MAEPEEGLRSRQKASRRDAILEAARTLMLEVGYDGVTLEAVAERAELTKPTLYAYFESKEELLLEAYLRVLELSRTTRQAFSDDFSPLQQLSTIAIRVIESNFGSASNLYAWPPPQISTHPRFIATLDQIHREIAEIVRAGQRLGEIEPSLEPLTAVQFYFSIAGNHYLRHLVDDGTLTPEELIDQLHGYIVRSFLPAKPYGAL